VREIGKAEVENAIEFVEGNTHVETGFGGVETITASLLHDGQTVEVEPADGVRVKGFDRCAFRGFEARAKRGDAVFDEVEARALHHVVFVVVSRGDDFFGDAECSANFGATKFAVFEELHIGGGECWLNDFATVPQEQRTVGYAGAVLAISQRSQKLLFLFIGEWISRANDETDIAVVFHNPTHEVAGGEVSAGGKIGGVERRQAAPKIERVG
jgi:hypothetical protein